MAGEWETMPVAEAPLDIIDGDRGVNYPKQEDFASSGDCLFLNTGNVTTTGFSFSDRSFITKEKDAVLRKGKLQRHDVVLTTRGTVGNVALFDDSVRYDHVRINSGMVLLRADQSKLWPRFLYQLVRSQLFKEQVAALTTGSAQPQLPIRDIRRVEIPLPPLAEQKAIAAMLGALDDKIELNRRMNATLEAMARALFQSWFVDFDPVRAKLDARQPTGLDPATAALFPEHFQDSSVGHIPQGWKVAALDDLTSFVIGGDWGATDATGDETVSCYCIRGADIPSLQEGGIGKMPSRFLKPSSVEKRQLMDGDLAIEISGGSPTQCTGRPVLVSDGLLRSLGRPLVASNFCRIVKLKSPAFSKFVYCWLRSLYDAGSLFQFETGTTGIKNFAFVLFSEKYPLVVPDQAVAEAFDRAVSPFFARIQANAHQSRTLATLRDTLLPKLLSGELSVAAEGTTTEGEI